MAEQFARHPFSQVPVQYEAHPEVPVYPVDVPPQTCEHPLIQLSPQVVVPEFSFPEQLPLQKPTQAPLHIVLLSEGLSFQ